MKTLKTAKLIENFKSEELEDRLEFGKWKGKAGVKQEVGGTTTFEVGAEFEF